MRQLSEVKNLLKNNRLKKHLRLKVKKQLQKKLLKTFQLSREKNLLKNNRLKKHLRLKVKKPLQKKLLKTFQLSREKNLSKKLKLKLSSLYKNKNPLVKLPTDFFYLYLINYFVLHGNRKLHKRLAKIWQYLIFLP